MSPLDQEPWVQAELHPKISDTRRLQELLCLAGYAVTIDGLMGPATRAAIETAGRAYKAVDDKGNVWLADLISRLSQPMWGAVNRRKANDVNTFRQAVLFFALGYLHAQAREAPGGNRGPWVRMFSRGTEGLPWCGFFVSHVIRQASEAMKLPPPIEGSADCDAIAAQARKAGRFADGVGGGISAGIAPGDLMLLQKTPSDWFHVGIVAEISRDHVTAIEGNTNAQGSPEGVDVRLRFRPFGPGTDFVRMG